MSRGKPDLGTKKFRIDDATQRVAIRKAICKNEELERKCQPNERSQRAIHRAVIKGLRILIGLEDGEQLFYASLQIKLAKHAKLERYYLNRAEMSEVMTRISKVHPPFYRKNQRKKAA